MENCVICGSSKIVIDNHSMSYLGLPESLSIMKCRECLLRWLFPINSVDRYRSIYEKEYFENIPENYEELARERIPYFKRRIKKISELMKSTGIVILDIGAATGEFVNEAIKAGMVAEGIEPSEFARRKAREKYGIELAGGDALEMDIGREKYDVVYMNHVLEHIVDPHNLLKKIHLSLKRGGYLIVEIPYQFGTIYERLCKFIEIAEPINFSLYSIHHPFFYSPKSLKHLLGLHSYSDTKISVWKDYFYLKKIEALKYCKHQQYSFLELWLRVLHIYIKEMGNYNFMVAHARK